MEISDERLRGIERDIQEIKTTLAVLRSEHDTALTRQQQIEQHIGRVVWVVLTAILMGFMGWMMKGGFFDTGK